MENMFKKKERDLVTNYPNRPPVGLSTTITPELRLNWKMEGF
jgi:hypothetical protein